MKLAALQDEFGRKLVSQSPVLSQLFIHTLPPNEEPRRSWLITEKCKVDDHWWESFEAGNKVINLFDSFRTTVANPAEFSRFSWGLEFKGRAWYLSSAVPSLMSCLR